MVNPYGQLDWKCIIFLPFLGAKTLHSFIVKNTQNWYTIFVLGAIFVILPILLQFFYDTNISKYLKIPYKIIDNMDIVDIVGNADIFGNMDIVTVEAIWNNSKL